MTCLLEVDRLEARYGASQVLLGIDLAVRAGEVVTLLGRNGMGKSTTVKSIIGILKPARGAIRFAGRDVAGQPSYKIAQTGIGLVPEQRQVFPNLTVRENLVATARKGPWTLERVFRLFPHIEARKGNYGNQLSGGEQQMLAIGRALLTNPRLLILDEATEGLSPLLREEIWACLRRLRAAGQAILLVDKYVEKLVGLADTHTIIEKGRVAWRGASRELAAERGLWQRYLGVA